MLSLFGTLLLVTISSASRRLLQTSACSLVRCSDERPNCVESNNGAKCVGSNGNDDGVNPCAAATCLEETKCVELGNNNFKCVEQKTKTNNGKAKGKCEPGGFCMCTMDYNPVCCKGTEYSNPCRANCQCEKKCTEGACCQCETDEYAPVCCDGVTYTNVCRAGCAVGDTSICTKGECPQPEQPVFCGGIAGIQCPDRYECFDDPSDECDPTCGGADCGGICVKVWDDGKGNTESCGGIAGFQCPDGFQCYDDKSDSCSATCGGADCIGICADVLMQ